MDWFNFSGSTASILGAIFALMAWIKAHNVQKQLQQEKERQSKNVVVTLSYGLKKIELPVELRRAELTRAEILGRLGMLPMKEKGKRFSIGYLSTPEFLQQLNQIVEGFGNGVLSISCTEQEFDQFDLVK